MEIITCMIFAVNLKTGSAPEIEPSDGYHLQGALPVSTGSYLGANNFLLLDKISFPASDLLIQYMKFGKYALIS